MQRMAMVIGVAADKISDYKILHAQCWPEILQGLREAHIRNYSIYLRGARKIFCLAIGNITGMLSLTICKRLQIKKLPAVGGHSARPVNSP